MLCEGYSQKRIADIFMVTVSTVYQIYSDLLDKLENKE
ncbi:helix-turn-helix domain-containing protein [Staphylococcus aureus]|nr:helix-turn-helix domain-containing protein [Staphylococcus aureus]